MIKINRKFLVIKKFIFLAEALLICVLLYAGCCLIANALLSVASLSVSINKSTIVNKN